MSLFRLRSRKISAAVRCGLAAFGTLSVGSIAQAANDTWGANGNSAWYTATNWASGTQFPGLGGAAASNTDIATFTSAFTGTTVGIDMGTDGLNLGAISLDSTRITATNIGNSSTTAGVLRLYGATVGTTDNTILSNAGTGLFTVQATQTGAMGVVLSNTTNNIIRITNTGGIAISSILSESVAGNRLTLQGGGTGVLTLSGANTYTGGTTLAGGTVAISNATSFGTGNVSVTASSRINATGGITYANAIAVNAGQTLTLQNPATTTSTATFSGVLSGSGTISLPNSSTNGIQGILAFTNPANTFTGNVVLSASGSGDEFFTFNSLGDGGNFTFAKNGNRQGVTYTGANSITFNTRQIVVAATMVNGGATDRQGLDGGGANPVSMFANDGTGTVSFTQNMVVNNISSNYGVLYFGGSNTGSNTFAGNIGDTSGSSQLSIGKSGTGKWIFTGSNTYQGSTLIGGGTLSVGTIANANVAQPLGIGAGIQLGVSAAGILEYTGGTASTNKQVVIGAPVNQNANAAAGSILNNGTGPLTFTNATFNPTSASYIAPGGSTPTGTAITATRTLTLGGNYRGGINEIQGVIQNNAAAGLVAVTVSGGIWSLSGANTYTGGTNVNGGTLLISGANNLPATGTLAVAAGGNFSLADGTVRNTTAATVTLASGSLLSVDWDSTGTVDNLTPAAAITPAAGAAVGIIINPIGTPTGGGDVLTTTAGTSTLQNPNYFLANNTNFTATITKPAATGAGSVSIGGYADATPVTDAYWNRNQVPGATDTMAFSSGTLSNWATDAAGTSAGGVVPGGSGVNVIFGATSASAAVTVGADMNLGSITFNDTAAVTISGNNTITLNSTSSTAAATTAALATVTPGSAISVTSFANATNTISARLALGASQTWNVASGKELVVSGSVSGTGMSLTKAGAGTLTLTGTNTYSGLTSVTGGTLILRNGNNTATTGFSVASGATLRLGNAISLTSTQNITGAGNLGKDTVFFGDSTIAGTNNNYTGTTSVNVSTLTLAAGGVINGTSSITISSINNAALLNNGSITTPGAFTISGGNATSGIFTNSSTGVLNSASVSMAAGSTATNSGTFNSTGAFTSNGTFTSTGTLTTGAVTVGGPFTLGAGSSFTNTAGTIVINSGGLVSFGNASHLSTINTNGITINSGGSFATLPGFPTFGSVLASGKVLSTSAGAIALSSSSSENIDFTGFSALGLSASANAVLTGTITPAGGVYRFGGGGAATANLTVASTLSGTNAVVHSGVSSTTLTAINTYSGTTTVSGGTLLIGSAGSINGGAVSVTGGTLAVGGTATLNATSGGTVTTTGGSLATYSLNAIGASGSTIALNNSSSTLGVVFGGGVDETTNRIISQSLGGAFTNAGTGILTFSNNFAVANTALGITFAGGGRTVMQGVTGNTSALLNFNKGGVGTLTVNGTITPNGGNIRAQGGVLNFSSTATTTGNAIIASQRVVGGIMQFATGSSIKTADANTNGILGGWATFNNTTFAKTNGTGVAIDGLADASYTANTWTANTTNVDVTSSNTSSGLLANSLRFNTAGAITQTLSGVNLLTSGGILVTPAVGANTTTITGGTSLSAGATNATTDLIIHQHNTAGALTIASAIVNNGTGTTSLTKAGAGTVNFSTQKTYTGTTNVLAGVLNLSGGGGGSGVIRGTANVAAGATLRLSTGDATGFGGSGTAPLTSINLLGGNLDVNTTSNQTLGSAVISMTGGSITGVANSNIDFFGGGSALNTLASGTTSTISGVALSPIRQGSTTFTVAQGYTPSGIDLDIQGVIRTSPSGNAANAVFIKSGIGTLALSGTNTIGNTANNSIRIDAGTLMVGNGGTTGNLGSTTALLPVVNNATLSFNRSDAAGSFANVISGTGEVRQVGTGTTSLTGANTYTGATTVTAGILRINNTTGSGTGTGAVAVNSGGTLGGSGSIAGNVSVNAGGTLAPGNSPGRLTLSGNLTLATSSTYSVEITGPAAGAQYDQTLLIGTNSAVTISDATLAFAGTLGGTFVVNDYVTIIRNNGSGATTGTFAGLPEGSTVPALSGFGGVPDWAIYYGATVNSVTGALEASTGGNDVVLVAVPEPGAALGVSAVGLGLLRRVRRRRIG